MEVTNWKNKVDTETTEIQIVNEVIPTVAVNGLTELYYTTSSSILVGVNVSVGKNSFIKKTLSQLLFLGKCVLIFYIYGFLNFILQALSLLC